MFTVAEILPSNGQTLPYRLGRVADNSGVSARAKRPRVASSADSSAIQARGVSSQLCSVSTVSTIHLWTGAGRLPQSLNCASGWVTPAARFSRFRKVTARQSLSAPIGEG
jgi:hypothetical protein